MPAASVKEIAVGQDTFDDARSVSLTVSSVASARLFAPASGKVTDFACNTGMSVSSGDALLSLDGEPKLALATATPLWRDVTVGSRGDDVRAFQQELLRLGHAIEADGVAGRRTIDVATAAFADAGIMLSGSVVRVASLVWIPAATATIATCDVPVGADVQQGGTLATFTNASPVVSVTETPSDLVPGARVVRVGTTDFPVTATGEVRIGDVWELGATAVADSSEAGSRTVDAILALAEPLAVSVVPPGSVYNVKGTSGCVSSKGVAYRVSILGSQLGETIVSFASGNRPSHVDTLSGESAPCV